MPFTVSVPECHGLMVLARREPGDLADTIRQAGPGAWRDNQAFIGQRPQTARYVPPSPGEGPRLMEDLPGPLQCALDDVARLTES